MKYLPVVTASLLSSAFALTPLSSEDYGNRIRNCPGYAVNGAKTEQTVNGLKAHLQLAGDACDAFGDDVQNLVLEATYETKERLHIQIYDEHFQVPEEIFERPQFTADESLKDNSDLQFEYSEAPFAFWISRRSDGDILFDTRLSEIPSYDEPYNANDTSASISVMPNHNIIFEPQYIQLSSALPQNANIYGLGQVTSPSYRRNSSYTRQSFWNADQGGFAFGDNSAGTPTDTNLYGTHPFYLENRVRGGASYNHGLFFLHTGGLETWLRDGLIQFRAMSGIVDFYVISGGEGQNKPNDVIQQYSDLVGKPYLIPYWSLGFHLLRWGYYNDTALKASIYRMREERIPQESQWMDIEYMVKMRDFTVDPDSFSNLTNIVADLHEHGQKFIPMIDNGIPVPRNSSDKYPYYDSGHEKDVFMKNFNGTEYEGEVWPGWTVFPDPYAANTKEWWYESLAKWHKEVPFDSVWLDMNEASSFCSGSCGTGSTELEQYEAEDVTYWAEGYNPEVSGNSGNITVDGQLTYMQSPMPTRREQLGRRMGTVDTIDKDKAEDLLARPPYQLHNGPPNKFNQLDSTTISGNATHANGVAEYDVHNANGHMLARFTREALERIYNKQRSFIITRSTFAGSGKYTQLWLGDNYSTWQSMRDSIKGLFQFSAFQMPFTGADACGFGGNTVEELCTRWMELAAFSPFMRSHNTYNAIDQFPYTWDSTADASRKALKSRYELLPFFYTKLYQASIDGSAVVKPLWYEWPEMQELFAWDEQYFLGDELLITPVLRPNTTTVEGYFPGDEPYYDIYTGEKLAPSADKVILDAPLTHINVHVRGGSVLVKHSKADLTVTQTTASPFNIMVALNREKSAKGSYWFDDGSSEFGNTSVTQLNIQVNANGITSDFGRNDYQLAQNLDKVTVAGCEMAPKQVKNNDMDVEFEHDADTQVLTISGLKQSLNAPLNISWN
ncbi:hypothetical protein E3Q03_03394 [Wallemia mellicola]|uniref:Maltase n=1 Tax=Wallemia mellicola TaxID=1708541 RepID=A0AB74KA81_9BASI|nr:hypothetical protein E3Q04_03612 [Wallemia mellicola]TIC60147.1 hypothetical protein E3Q03_03394 [Wallemia mellicola]